MSREPEPDPVRAALAAARREGLPTGGPRVLRDVTNVLVHLAPAPVVARVPRTFTLLRGPEWFATEVRLARLLAGLGAPVVAPAGGVDPGPHPVDGAIVSFWSYVEHDPARADPRAAGAALRELHRALAHVALPLPPFERLDELGRLIALLDGSPVLDPRELAGLRAAHARLSQAPRRRDRVQPLHGDAHLRNVLWTPSGPLWSDFEAACTGPVEVDLAALVWRGLPGEREALAAYGEHDPAVRAAVEPYVALFLAAWTAVVVARRPSDEARAELRRRVERATRAAVDGS